MVAILNFERMTLLRVWDCKGWIVRRLIIKSNLKVRWELNIIEDMEVMIWNPRIETLFFDFERRISWKRNCIMVMMMLVSNDNGKSWRVLKETKKFRFQIFFSFLSVERMREDESEIWFSLLAFGSWRSCGTEEWREEVLPEILSFVYKVIRSFSPGSLS